MDEKKTTKKQAYTEARKAANKRSDAKYGQILVKPQKEDAQAIREAAAEAGESIQGYIVRACRERMERDHGQKIKK